jgi:hypothetical protein
MKWVPRAREARAFELQTKSLSSPKASKDTTPDNPFSGSAPPTRAGANIINQKMTFSCMLIYNGDITINQNTPLARLMLLEDDTGPLDWVLANLTECKPLLMRPLKQKY